MTSSRLSNLITSSLVAAITAGATVVATSGASQSPSPVTYYACDKGGTLSLVATRPSKCTAGAVRISWNQVGPSGPQGARGMNGSTGKDGLSGPQGLPGLKGDTGSIGPQGLKGDNGVTGAQGTQGVQGPIGLTGSQGQRGSVWSTGGSTPIYVAGETSGDTYLNTSTGDLYQFTGFTWVKNGNIQGPTGPTGPTGPQGIPGPSGSNGTSAILPQGGYYFKYQDGSAPRPTCADGSTTNLVIQHVATVSTDGNVVETGSVWLCPFPTN